MISCGSAYTLGPLLISSLLIEHNYDVKLIQYFNVMTFEQRKTLIDTFITSEKQIIGISTTFFLFEPVARRILKNMVNYILSKFPNIRFVFGGTLNKNNLEYLSTIVDFTKPNIFKIFGKDRENEILDLFNRLTGRIIKIPYIFENHSPTISNIFKEPFTMPGFLYHLELSRSCRFKCSFCSYNKRGRVEPYKNKHLIIRELEDFYKTFKTPFIMIIDSTFNDDEDKLKVFIEAIKELSFVPQFWCQTRLDLYATQPDWVKDFYQKYVKLIFFGIESLNPKTLLSIKKSSNVTKIKQTLLDFKNKAGTEVKICTAFIIGLPHETFETAHESVKWVKDNITDHVIMQPLRLQEVKESELGQYTEYYVEYSDMDKNPQEYGYTILPKVSADKFMRTNNISNEEFLDVGINPESIDSHPAWVRNDGYSYENAIYDLAKIKKELELKNHINMWQSASYMARGEKIPTFSNLSGNSFNAHGIRTVNLDYQSEDDLIVGKFNKEFIDEYFNYLMKTH